MVLHRQHGKRLILQAARGIPIPTPELIATFRSKHSIHV